MAQSSNPRTAKTNKKRKAAEAVPLTMSTYHQHYVKIVPIGAG
jgi:hypothetical protein